MKSKNIIILFLKKYAIYLWVILFCISSCVQDNYQSGQYYKIEYQPSIEKDGLQLGVTYMLWIPNGVNTVRGIIVHQHGAGTIAAKAGLTAAYDLHWQALAKKWDCALMGTSYHVENDDVGDIPGGAQLWFDARRGSDQTFRQSLEEFSAISGHPEISSVPWCLWGHSGGAIWSHVMATLHPERVVAVWLRSGTANMWKTRSNFSELKIPEAIYLIPIMCNPGIQEQKSVIWSGQIEMFKEHRVHGAPIGFASDPLTGHWCGDSRYLAIPFFDACMEMRLPQKGSKIQTLRPVDMSISWVAPLLSDTAMPLASWKADIVESVWLPNEKIAEKWVEYVKTGLVSDCTPPPAPFNVKVVGNKVIWNAEADFESGISHFIILRDGKYYARVPEESIMQYQVRPLFQSGNTNSYHDTPADPIPEMSFTDLSPEGKHIYTVISVNSAGLPSMNYDF